MIKDVEENVTQRKEGKSPLSKFKTNENDENDNEDVDLEKIKQYNNENFNEPEVYVVNSIYYRQYLQIINVLVYLIQSFLIKNIDE